MKMIDIDWHPDNRKLWQFSVCSLFGFAVLGLFVSYRMDCFSGSGNWIPSCILLGSGLFVFVLGVFYTKAVKSFYVVLMLVALPFGFVVSHVIMAIIYYGLFTPLALVFRLMGRDSLHRSYKNGSYWIKREGKPRGKKYYRQY